MKANIVWQDKMKFSATGGTGHTVAMDAAEKVGGEDSASRPKEMILFGLAGCTAMDVISILRKMQVPPKSLRVEVEANETEDHPKIFETIHLKYIVSGDVPEDRLKRAIELSQDLYCGVSAMLRHGSKITHEYIYE